MNAQLVIFDFDGTIADSYPWFLSVFEDITRRYRLPPVKKEDVDRLRSFDIAQLQREYKIPIWKIILIGRHLKRLMREQVDLIRLVAGMQTVLEDLSNSGIRLALVTSNDGANVRRILGPQNTARFLMIESGVSMFGKKARFQKILKMTQTQPDRAMCIGDEIRDLKSAHAARIPFGAVTWGYTDEKLLQAHSPEALFTLPGQIVETVCRPAA